MRAATSTRWAPFSTPVLGLRPPVEGGSVASILEKVQRGEIAPLERSGGLQPVWVLWQFAGDGQRNYETWKSVVEKLGVRTVSSGYRANGTLVVNCEGNKDIADSGPLAGMPISDLRITRTSVSDLRPLRGMPLARLFADDLRELSGLEPLRGMPLRTLNVYGCNVTALSPLRGMGSLTFRLDR